MASKEVDIKQMSSHNGQLVVLDHKARLWMREGDQWRRIEAPVVEIVSWVSGSMVYVEEIDPSLTTDPHSPSTAPQTQSDHPPSR